MKDQMADVVAAVERLSKEVSDLKSQKECGREPSVLAPVTQKVAGTENKEDNVWNKPSHMERIKQEHSKITVCVKNDGERIDMQKVREVVSAEGIRCLLNFHQKNVIS